MLSVFSGAAPIAQGSADMQTLTGIVGCEWQVTGRYECRRRTRQDCIRECVSVGSPYVLAVDKRMHRLSGNAAEFDKAAGATAVVTGTVDGEEISVRSITDVEKRHSIR
jgi:hypothetical protein